MFLLDNPGLDSRTPTKLHEGDLIIIDRLRGHLRMTRKCTMTKNILPNITGAEQYEIYIGTEIRPSRIAKLMAQSAGLEAVEQQKDHEFLTFLVTAPEPTSVDSEKTE